MTSSQTQDSFFLRLHFKTLWLLSWARSPNWRRHYTNEESRMMCWYHRLQTGSKQAIPPPLTATGSRAKNTLGKSNGTCNPLLYKVQACKLYSRVIKREWSIKLKSGGSSHFLFFVEYSFSSSGIGTIPSHSFTSWVRGCFTIFGLITSMSRDKWSIMLSTVVVGA